jgi:lipoprotein-anchoring transpeptidase ErfK/SrfK
MSRNVAALARHGLPSRNRFGTLDGCGSLHWGLLPISWCLASTVFIDGPAEGLSVVNIRNGLIGVLLGVAPVWGAAPHAFALDGWIDGKPVFEGDLRRYQRDERRRQYGVIYPEFMTGGPRPEIAPVAPPIVSLTRAEPSGTVIIDTGGRRLFYVLPGNQAYEYPISVGREGFTWTGSESISRVAPWPDWHPPAEMRERQPGLPKIMTGGIHNPLGAKALYLGNTLYRIHGTNDPKTIGRASSSGCFRMMNEHVTHLASLAGVGTQVKVVARY